MVRKDDTKPALLLIKVKAIAWVCRIFPFKSVVILVYIRVYACLCTCVYIYIYTYLQLQLVEGYRRQLGESLRWETG